jgi:branched-chain amino acid transport system ATP-binding protein
MGATPACLLETQGLTIRFGGLEAIKDLDAWIRPGEILGLIGPNGSGKTTFLNLITGIYKPTSGNILFQGKSVVGEASFRMLRKGVARTFQNSRLFSNLSVLDNVIIGMHHKLRSQWYHAVFRSGFARRELQEAAQKALDLLQFFSRDLLEDRYKKAVELPQAHRRKLEICRAIASDPLLRLLDEPAAGMDPEETRQLMEDIRKIQRRKADIAIIVIEHDMNVIRNIADRVIVINHGQKIAEGSFAEICQEPSVLEAYLGESSC